MGAAIGWPLVALAAWLVLSVLAVAAGARIARLRHHDAGALEAGEPVHFEPMRERPASDGYASLLLTRLVVHARRVLGVDQAILLVRGHRQPNRLIVVAAHGAEEDLVGRAVPIRGVLQRLVSDRPLRHGPLEEIVPDGGIATAMTTAAPVPSGELALLCAASDDCERGFTRHELELLGELSATCAAAISDVALGARLEPTMRVLAGGLSGPETEEIHRPVDAPSLADQVGTALGLDQPALAELDMAAHACETRDAERVAEVPGLEAVSIVVRFLAERWDGEGEPRGLSGEQIPLASRILTACLELGQVMAGGGTSLASALRQLKAERGGAFDPVVVDAIAHVLTPSAAPLDARGWARADAQFGEPLLVAVG